MPWSTDFSTKESVRYSHTAVAANGTNSSDWLDVGAFNRFSVQVVHANHTDTSSWRIQTNNDATNADNLSGATGTTAAAAGSATIQINDLTVRQLRLNISEADGSATSTLTPFIVAYRK